MTDDQDEIWPPLPRESLDRIAWWQSLPVAQRDAWSRASNGLLNGDPMPLAAYIREGWPIDATLAGQIANAIEGPDGEGYTLQMVSEDARRLKFDDRDELHRRNLNIALFYRAEKIAASRAGWSGTDDEIYRKIREKFSVGRSTAAKAVSEIRQEIGEDLWKSEESSEHGSSLD
ncbi:hypothetical protein [Aurantiacibacter hainanensis]|uniref:hypothetical protein n=1 Tax=Aurantiacibacter hainanensis TaxID=3076114 RepID=UPI0030C6B56A